MLKTIDRVMSSIPGVRAVWKAPYRMVKAVVIKEAPQPQPQPQPEVALGPLWDSIYGVQTQVAALWERLDFVRAETMFEMRAMMAGGQDAPGYKTDTVGRVVNQAKVDSALADGGLHLNVGCGHLSEAQFVNVDGRELPGVDVVADASDIPFEDNTVTELFSSHLLEHFPVEHCRRSLLPHWFRLLKPKGELRAIVPDAEGMIEDYTKGDMSFADLREVTFGLQEYDGDFHFNMFSRESLKELLMEVGFEAPDYRFVNRKNGKCRDMEIVARKP